MAGRGRTHDSVLRLVVAACAVLSIAFSQFAVALDATALLDWAEANYPHWFPGPKTNLHGAPYTYRHYPETGNYLGVAGDAVFALGPVVGNSASPVQVGSLAGYECIVFPADCGSGVVKPRGLYASASGATIYAHPELRGVLIRVKWSEIEPRPGSYDLAPLDAQVAQVRQRGKEWSLAVVAGGPGSPSG